METHTYAAVIFDPKNIVIRVEERPTWERANKAGRFYTKTPGTWYMVVKDQDIDLFENLINA